MAATGLDALSDEVRSAHAVDEGVSETAAAIRLGVVVWSLGLGTAIGAATGACLSPGFVWLTNSPVAFLIAPAVGAAAGAFVGALFGLAAPVK
jgi:hypothetical protein